MSAQVIETTQKNGEVYVSVTLGSKRARFECLADATKWLRLMKLTGDIERIEVLLRQIVLMRQREYKYESCFVM